ncbi:VOC family protein [Halobacteria archaeon AArc-curdl1]|uniref:VOC family protein n=1 Tax=Natronosalvus hydrolyticus TaxID=2979988 RepID=A0AAP3E8E4_9EURY|nr:VOC family protein [Halobacteria archaeon AArc-curdl1]
MLRSLAWLGLEVKYLEPARRFYEETLELSPREGSPAVTEPASAVAYPVGDTDLVLRRPNGVPRGGLHTHYALSIPAEEYDDWWDRLSGPMGYDLDEYTFGSSRSLYLYDPDGNCVELGQTDVDGPGIDGLFEVVLEVESLERAESLYSQLGFETIDRGEERVRVRMAGPVALELWEPHLGLAEARGGVHVDLGFETDDIDRIRDTLEGTVCSLERTGDRLVARDPDGHHLTFCATDSSQ